MNKTLLYFKTWMKATGRNLVSAKVLSLVVLLSAVPYAAFSGNGSLSEVSESMQAGTQTVSGTVQDQDGTPLIGVTVTSSPSNGVVTDVNGKFTIKVPSGAELTFNYLGYKTVKVKVGTRTTINVKMESDAQQLEEQVVVGYGTQKKVSVVAAVSSVNSKELRQSSSPNLANALAGRLAGLTSLQSGGSQPGFDDADLYLRGASTTNGTRPLILIDGVPRDNIRTLDANEVATVSVLKDAAATAVYGVRGANGVILITTKRGEVGQTKLDISFDQSFQAFTREPERVDSWEFMTLRNEANRNDGMNEEYSGKMISRSLNPLMGLDPNDPDYALKAARRHYMYPNHDWYREIFKKWSPQSRVNINISGGTEKLQYFVNASYLHQGGNLHTEPKSKLGYDPQARMTRYSFRSNLDYNITKNFKAFLNLGSYIEKVGMPGTTTYGGDNKWMIRDLIHCTVGMKPMTVGPTTPDASLGYDVIPDKVIRPVETDRSPFESVNRKGYRDETRTNLNASIGGEWNMTFITKGLSLKGMASFDAVANTILGGDITEMSFATSVDEDNDQIYFAADRELNGTLSLSKSGYTNYTVNLQGSLNYSRTFGKHDVGAMILVQRDFWETNGAPLNMPYNMMGMAARVTYGFDNRYLLDANMGYNGSEQFSPKNRFGFFPSFAVGWVVSNENFLKGNKVITNLKLRASYGKVGSDKIGDNRFLYLSNHTYSSSGGVAVGGYGTIYENRPGNYNLQWEVSKKQNYGIDLQLWSDWSITFDYFIEQRSKILKTQGMAPQFAGVPQWPYLNLGVVDNSGYELEINYNKSFNKDLFLSVKGNFSYNHNKVKFWDEVPYADGYYYQYRTTGQSLNQTFGYKIDWSNGNGYFNTQEELDKYTEGYVDENGVEHKGITYNLSTAPQLGDFKYIDQNGDGIIDEKDRVPIGYTNVPRVSYGLNVSLNYKWFDFTVFLQGVGKYSSYYSGQGVYENIYQGTFFKYHKTAWTAERYAAGQKITYPRLSTGETCSKIQNDFFVMDRAFIRLKAIELGYTLPSNALRAIGINKLRVYFRGDNLVTWDRLRTSTTDPEQTDQIGYPIVKTFNFGFNVTF
ncbi:TonB-dependent receptor [Alistipes sp.]|uniref:SusC/RagA family TonB-linked outer membrane protein n=1 Tax=Alistipes sp. TaxID=1872444 RepID=UPI0028773DD1|nr:TonB-dependent receptor [Alistipes sp.]